jgi:hypothetical protein
VGELHAEHRVTRARGRGADNVAGVDVLDGRANALGLEALVEELAGRQTRVMVGPHCVARESASACTLFARKFKEHTRRRKAVSLTAMQNLARAIHTSRRAGPMSP